MANKQQDKEKRRAARLRNSTKHRMDQDEIEKEELDSGDDTEIEEVPEVEIVGKDYGEPMPGPTSYSELDAAMVAREQAQKVREETYTVQELVSNIAYSMMTPDQKSKAIVSVGEGFGSRLKKIVNEKVEKDFVDMELLELKAIVARDSRHTSVIEKAKDFIASNFSTPDPATKTYIRKWLKDTIAILEKAENITTRESVPELLKAAKDAGIGVSDSIMIEKDATGSWRAVLWPSNNFEDRDKETLTEKSHLEFVEWINKNMDCSPAFATWHKPGTRRENYMDFVAYEKGFLLMSTPLTEKEAVLLLKMQIQTDIGLSIGGIALERDKEDSNIITKYRIFEVSDLPIERAANPFTNIELISKEAQMDIEKYLSDMLGDSDRAKKILGKMELSQKNLREAGVKEKEVADSPEAPVTKNAPAQPVDLKELVEKMSTELGMKELSDTIAVLMETAEKVPVLEGLVKELAASKDDALAEMISPKIEKSLSWMKVRPTQKSDNVLDPAKEEDEKLQKSVPELGWLSEATGTQPVQV